MDSQAPSTTENELKTLREGILHRYRTYHRQDPDRFPILEYNTNRANYEPLKDSFEEEFYKIRHLDRNSPNVHIPSTNTLAMLFTDAAYVPSRKILNTCRSYAEGPTQPFDKPRLTAYPQPEPSRAAWGKQRIGIGLTSLLCLCITATAVTWLGAPAPGGLTITRPVPNSGVPQEVIIEGKVAHANTVWVAVRSKVNGMVWVQPPILVQDDGVWIGVVYVGKPSRENEGYAYQIRAFVNPASVLTSGNVLPDWPAADLSSNVVEVVRGSKNP